MKKKGVFLCEYFQAVQELSFCHSTKGEKATRYYSGHVSFTYPLLERIANNMDVITNPAGTQIGYLMPKHYYAEWRLSDSDSERIKNSVITDIVKSIKKYVIPYVRQFPTLKSFVEGESNGLLSRVYYDKKWPPIIYRLLGEEEKAQDYIELTLKKLAEYKEPKNPFEYKEKNDGFQVTFHSPGNRNLEIYQDFARKFNESKDVFPAILAKSLIV